MQSRALAPTRAVAVSDPNVGRSDLSGALEDQAATLSSVIDAPVAPSSAACCQPCGGEPQPDSYPGGEVLIEAGP